MTNLNNNASSQLIEEMNHPLTAIDNTDSAAKKDFSSKYWTISLLYGAYGDNPRSTYAIEAISRLGDKESAVYLYSEFTHKKSKDIQEDMNDFGFLPEGEFEKMKAYAEYLKINNLYTPVANLDVLVGGYNKKVKEYKEMILDYVLENSESIAKKSEGNYEDKKFSGAWLDEDVQINKYGEVVFALVNSKLKEILNITDTKKLGQIKHQLNLDGFLLNKEPKDITLSKGNEKKCSLFRIPMDKQ